MATGTRAIVNGVIGSLVSIPSVCPWDLVGSLIRVLAGEDEGSVEAVDGVKVGGNSVCVGASWIAVCSAGSSSVRVE
jgi:hypothetical protein